MLWDPNKDKPVEPVLDEVGKVMWLAADYLETHRWGQGDFILANGAVCLAGALLKVKIGKVYSYKKDDEQVRDCPITSLALTRLEAYLNKESAISWNDAPERKKAEVIAALREAAKLK